MEMTNKTLLDLIERANLIQNDEKLNWEDKYLLIFSDHISTKIYDKLKENCIKFEYYDPNSDYEDDVRAYVTALNDNKDRFEAILAHLC